MGTVVNTVSLVVGVGEKLHVLSLKQGISKKPLFCTTLQDVVIWFMMNVPVQEITVIEGS